MTKHSKQTSLKGEGLILKIYDETGEHAERGWKYPYIADMVSLEGWGHKEILRMRQVSLSIT